MGALRELTWGRRKTVDATMEAVDEEGFRLRRELSALDITVLGIGVIIGAGIFVLTGNAAATEAGPGIMLSFVLAGVICALAARTSRGRRRSSTRARSWRSPTRS